MIQLSIQPGTETAKAPQTAASGPVPDGLFAAMLEGQMISEDGNGGKVLPDPGKDLPVEPAFTGKGMSEAGKTEIQLTQTAIAETLSLLPKTADAENQEDSELPDTERALAEEGTTQPVDATALSSDVSIPVLMAIIPQAAQSLPVATADGDMLLGRGGTPVPLPAAPLPISLPEAENGEQQRPAQTPLPKLAPAASADASQLYASDSAAKASAETVQATDTAEPSREQASLRLPAARQIRIDLTQDGKVETANPAGELRTGERTVQVSALSQAATASLGDGSVPSNGQNAPRVSLHTPAAIQPHDFSALVDRLVEAREAARPQTVNLSVMNSDFGEVSLRFSHDDRGLSVSMASNDPEFNRAVGNAMPADRSATGENAGQNGRRDDSTQHSSSRGANDSSSASNNGGEAREQRNTQRTFTAIRENPSHQVGEGGARNGIFA